MRQTSRHPRRLAAARPLLARHAEFPDLDVASQSAAGGRGLLRSIRVVRRAISILIWTLACMPVQAICLLLPGRPKVVFVSNHSSWIDVPVLGGRLDACFVSKDDVAQWPFISTIARLGRTVFVSRRRHATARELDRMRDRLAAGDNLLLFPEGTSSDGSRVLPFRSS